MKIGAIFPQTEYGSQAQSLRDYAQLAEELGYTHILAYEHVLGANPQRPEGFQGPYTYQHSFQEPFVLFGFMAAVTRRIGFATGILILPQRQTALVAKQAATLDVLSEGRLRLGVALGWNAVEYAALGQDFHSRGRRIEEQVQLLRHLWTQPLVQFDGRWDTVTDAGLNPLPVQRPIPIWFGGHAENVIRRAAQTGDGWLPNYRTVAEARPSFDLLESLLQQNGRTRASFGIEVRLSYAGGDPHTWIRQIEAWQAAGATHLTLNTMGAGLQGPVAHQQALRSFAEAVGLKKGN